MTIQPPPPPPQSPPAPVPAPRKKRGCCGCCLGLTAAGVLLLTGFIVYAWYAFEEPPHPVELEYETIPDYHSRVGRPGPGLTGPAGLRWPGGGPGGGHG